MVFLTYTMKNEEAILTDFEFSDDLIESYENNKDIGFLDLKVKQKVESLPVGTLLKVIKKIGSPIKILSANEVDDALIRSMIGE